MQTGIVLVKKWPGSKSHLPLGGLLQQQCNLQPGFFPLGLISLCFIPARTAQLQNPHTGWKKDKMHEESEKTQISVSSLLRMNRCKIPFLITLILILKDSQEDDVRTILSEHCNRWAWLFFSHFRVLFINFQNVLIVSNVSSKRNFL